VGAEARASWHGDHRYNVVRRGAVIDPASRDANVIGVRTFLELVSKEPRVSATAVQTVEARDYDGFAMVVVTSD